MGKKGSSKKERLQVARVVDVPLQEVSGVCVRREQDHRLSLIAIGDRAAMLAWAHVSSEDQSLDWQTVDISRLPGSALPEKDPQIEAACADGAGRVLLLQEEPPRSISLEVEGRGDLGRSWTDPQGSRGEGAVMLPCGHLLVAKEKDPTALIEFGPDGATPQGLGRGGALGDGVRWPVENGEHRFVPLAVWRPDKSLNKTCDDFSDLEIGPDGRLYLLSDQSESIARLDDLAPGGDTVTLTASWRLHDLDAKPEGLAFAPDGRAIVALDTRKARNNLVLLEPAITAP
jgi:hypothetical protein